MSIRRDLPESPYLAAAAGRKPHRQPVWFMRQAGRSLPEYRALRARHSMLAACLDAELVCEITLQPVRRHDVDAAILFSDIVVPLRGAGVDLDIVADVGPVIADPVRSAADIAALKPLDPQQVQAVAGAVSLLVETLGEVPLIGFAGAPFTVASYLVEGGPSRDQLRTRAMMHADPDAWNALAGWVARGSAAFLRAQVLAGASALQLFDSWVGGLSRADYRRFVQPHSAAVLSAVADLGVPRVHFGLGTGELMADLAAAGADVMGVDHRIPLDVANQRLGGRIPLQGNIDPAMLFAGPDPLAQHVRAVLAAGASAPAHVLNLGHGVPPDTDPGVLTALVDLVHGLPDTGA